MSCTKKTIIASIAEKLWVSERDAQWVVEELLEMIKSTLASGEDLKISGFGKFCVKQKLPHKGRNPATGDKMMLAGRRVITFKCSGKLREKINNSRKFSA